MIPTPDWQEPCTLTAPAQPDRQGALYELVFVATRDELEDRPQYLLVSTALGELDNEQIEDLRRRPDYPGA